MEGYVPKRAPIPPEVMSRMAIAKTKLEAQPLDPKVQGELHSAMVQYQLFQDEQHRAFMNDTEEARKATGYDGPGLWTGQGLVEPMSKDMIDSDDIRIFARPDMFMNLKPLRENYGKNLMKRYGWREGKPLGTTGLGSLAPIEVTVKIDRKGLANEREFIQRKPEGPAKNQGPGWICKLVNLKNPVCGLGEIHQAMGLPTPVYSLKSEVAGVFRWNVISYWGSFTPSKGTKNKKQAKANCAYEALKEILRIESDRIGVIVPTEASDSCFLRVIFVPTNKTAAGHKMLYKHFYSGGHLDNFVIPPGYTNDETNPHIAIEYDFTRTIERKEDPTIIPSTAYDPAPAIPLAPTQPSKPARVITGPLRTGTNWMLKVINKKNASSALLDLCLAMNQTRPEEYSQYIGGSNVATVKTNWGTFTHSEGHRSRREARKLACYTALKALLKREAAKYGMKPPYELAESSESCIAYAPDNT